MYVLVFVGVLISLLSGSKLYVEACYVISDLACSRKAEKHVLFLWLNLFFNRFHLVGLIFWCSAG